MSTAAKHEASQKPLTQSQLVALTAAVEKGGAWYARTAKMGGAYSRMLDGLVVRDLLEASPPYVATMAGRAAYAAEKERKLQAAYRKGVAWACHEMLKRRQAECGVSVCGAA